MKSRIHETHVRMARHRDGVKGLSIEPGNIKREEDKVPGQGKSKTGRCRWRRRRRVVREEEKRDETKARPDSNDHSKTGDKGVSDNNKRG